VRTVNSLTLCGLVCSNNLIFLIVASYKLNTVWRKIFRGEILTKKIDEFFNVNAHIY